MYIRVFIDDFPVTLNKTPIISRRNNVCTQPNVKNLVCYFENKSICLVHRMNFISVSSFKWDNQLLNDLRPVIKADTVIEWYRISRNCHSQRIFENCSSFKWNV